MVEEVGRRSFKNCILPKDAAQAKKRFGEKQVFAAADARTQKS